jgi:4-hydroxy-3-polyprenylbenzoate decarboxylase
MDRYIFALTGASGMPYALTLLEILFQLAKTEIHIIISEAATEVFSLETEISLDFLQQAHAIYSQYDIGAPPASGSWKHRGMIICPCSMATLAAICHGMGDTLIHRAADVTLKEQRQLVLVPRETPLHQIHLQNMLSLVQAGATLIPACPGFYHKPQHIQEMINFVAARVLDHLDIEHNLAPRWKEEM